MAKKRSSEDMRKWVHPLKPKDADVRKKVKSLVRSVITAKRDKEQTIDKKIYTPEEYIQAVKKYAISELFDMSFSERIKLRILGKSMGVIARSLGFIGQPDLVRYDLVRFLQYIWGDEYESKLEQEKREEGNDPQEIKNVQNMYIEDIKQYGIKELLAMSRAEKSAMLIRGRTLKEIADILHVFTRPALRPKYMEMFLRRVRGEEYESKLAEEEKDLKSKNNEQ